MFIHRQRRGSIFLHQRGEDLTTNFYMPRLDFWPGAVVISSSSDLSTASYSSFAPALQADVLGAGAIVSTIPSGDGTGAANVLDRRRQRLRRRPQTSKHSRQMQTGGIPGATILKAANGLQTR